MITGKSKERFKIFYETIKGGNYKIPYQNFMAYPFEMQQGVYLAYYDSLGVDCEVYNGFNYMKPCWTYDILENQIEIFEGDIAVKSRNEALIEAFKQADKLENEKLKK